MPTRAYVVLAHAEANGSIDGSIDGADGFWLKVENVQHVVRRAAPFVDGRDGLGLQRRDLVNGQPPRDLRHEGVCGPRQPQRQLA